MTSFSYWHCLCALCGMLMAGSSLAAIYTCTTANTGTVTFQDMPCTRTAGKPIAKNDKPVRNALGIHKSWFEVPSMTANSAYCDEHGCECGSFARKFSTEMTLVVTDALYIDGSWQRYENNVFAWKTAPEKSALAAKLKAELEESACNIMMAQQTLKLFGAETLASLHKLKRDAEDRGYDTVQFCEESNTEACYYVDAFQRYSRMVQDLNTLQIPRTDSGEKSAELAEE